MRLLTAIGGAWIEGRLGITLGSCSGSWPGTTSQQPESLGETGARWRDSVPSDWEQHGVDGGLGAEEVDNRLSGLFVADGRKARGANAAMRGFAGRKALLRPARAVPSWTEGIAPIAAGAPFQLLDPGRPRSISSPRSRPPRGLRKLDRSRLAPGRSRRAR